jgi:hypothetical protein
VTQKKRLSRGLFSSTKTVADLNSAGSVRDFFARIKGPAVRLEENLDLMRAAARRALTDAGLSADTQPDDKLEGNAAIGAEVLMHIELLQASRRDDRTIDAINEAMLATEKWMQLRANALFEKPVREKQRRVARSSAVTRAQIIDALESEPTVIAAAEKLGIVARQIGNRIKKPERDAIQLRKKQQR